MHVIVRHAVATSWRTGWRTDREGDSHGREAADRKSAKLGISDRRIASPPLDLRSAHPPHHQPQFEDSSQHYSRSSRCQHRCRWCCFSALGQLAPACRSRSDEGDREDHEQECWKQHHARVRLQTGAYDEQRIDSHRQGRAVPCEQCSFSLQPWITFGCHCSRRRMAVSAEIMSIAAAIPASSGERGNARSWRMAI